MYPARGGGRELSYYQHKEQYSHRTQDKKYVWIGNTASKAKNLKEEERGYLFEMFK